MNKRKKMPNNTIDTKSMQTNLKKSWPSRKEIHGAFGVYAAI